MTHIEEIPELEKLHRTLVRFDCIVTDMFDEEFFVSTLPRVEPPGQLYAYKYHSEFDGVQCQQAEPTAENTLTRANIMGTTLTC